MIGFLKDVSVNTLIGELPSIIGWNNRQIEKEFDNIYDSSNNRIIKSVYVPTGAVKSHWGDFVNVKCDYISISNVESMKSTFNNVPHNYFGSRLFNASIDNNSDSTATIDYCHNPFAISSGLDDNHSLGFRLNAINSSIQAIYNSIGDIIEQNNSSSTSNTTEAETTTEVSTNNTETTTTALRLSLGKPLSLNSLNVEDEELITYSYSVDTNWVETKQSAPQGYSYDKTLATNTNRVILKTVKTKQEYEDIVKGEINNYINVDEPNIKIKANITNILYAQEEGQIVNILLDENNVDKRFIIKIEDSKYIIIKGLNDTMLFNLKLIATQVNEDKMSFWSVYSYNVPSNASLITQQKIKD